VCGIRVVFAYETMHLVPKLQNKVVFRMEIMLDTPPHAVDKINDDRKPRDFTVLVWMCGRSSEAKILWLDILGYSTLDCGGFAGRGCRKIIMPHMLQH
jgi:hypothetical protein